MTTPTDRTVRSVDLSLGPGRQTLRVTLTLDQHGQPESVVLAAGFGGADSGDPFLRPAYLAEPLVLPASVLPELRQALDALEEES